MSQFELSGIDDASAFSNHYRRAVGRPVEELITFVDLEKMEVVEVVDDVEVPLPPFDRPLHC